MAGKDQDNWVYARRKSSPGLSMKPPHPTRYKEFTRLRGEIEAFIEQTVHPVVVEWEESLFELRQSSWDFRVEYGKLIFEVWNPVRSLNSLHVMKLVTWEERCRPRDHTLPPKSPTNRSLTSRCSSMSSQTTPTPS